MRWTASLSLLCLGYALFALDCGGSDFTSDQSTGGADAGLDAPTGGQGGSTSSGGQGGAGGGLGGTSSGGTAADAGSACDVPLAGADCNQVSTGDSACDTCGRANCCAEVNTCLADSECRRLLSCFIASCKNKEPVSCGAAACSACLGQVIMFTGVSGCLQANCNADCPFKAS